MKNKINFENIINDYGKIISSICNKMIMQREVAEEAAQEAWLEIYKSLDSFKEQSKLSTWIYRIAYRVIMNYAQKEKTYSTRFISKAFKQDEIVYDPQLEEKISHKEWTKEWCSKCLSGILHCLNNESRIMYLLRDITELSYEDISSIMKKNTQSVRKIVSRARHKIKNFIENECILFNKNGNCQCRMQKSVQKVDLKTEFEKIRNMHKEISILKQYEEVIPSKNYWENILC